MRLLGYEFKRIDGVLQIKRVPRVLSGVDDSRGWTRILDWKPGAWQQDAAIETLETTSQTWLYSCLTLIAGDIGKLRARLVTKKGRIWVETESPAYSPVLRKPNHYQTRQQFIEAWILSKLSDGNTYALKVRDGNGVVKALYVLDPRRVHPLVAPDGAVYYQLGEDDLNKLPVGLEAIPASEIIHDRMECLFHPLVGVSPLYAANLPAAQALQIQAKSKAFFANQSRPGGILTAPGRISEETAKRIKDYWDQNYIGDKAGKVAVLGDGLAYVAGETKAVDAQLVEQLQLTARQICSAFHVPPFMVGAADTPPYGNIAPAVQQYYNQCLQKLIEAFEATMDDGLGIGEGVKIGEGSEKRELGVELDLDALLRMDSKTVAEVEVLKSKGIASPNESREKFNLEPVTGGEKPLTQQQNYSLEALSKRDSGDDPFGTASPPAPPAAPAADSEERSIAIARLGLVADAAKDAAVAAAAGVTEAVAKVQSVEAALSGIPTVIAAQVEQQSAAIRSAFTESAAVHAETLKSTAEAIQAVAARQSEIEQRSAAAMESMLAMVQRAMEEAKQAKAEASAEAEHDAFVTGLALRLERAEVPEFVK